jgi:hypothetical protein
MRETPAMLLELKVVEQTAHSQRRNRAVLDLRTALSNRDGITDVSLAGRASLSRTLLPQCRRRSPPAQAVSTLAWLIAVDRYVLSLDWLRYDAQTEITSIEEGIIAAASTERTRLWRWSQTLPASARSTALQTG